MGMNTERDFLKKSMLPSGAAGLTNMMPPSIQRALAIDLTKDGTYLDADPRAARLADESLVWFQRDDSRDSYAPFRLHIKDTKATWMGSLPHGRASRPVGGSAH